MKNDESHEQTVDSLYSCSHGRTSWKNCPHCLLLNVDFGAVIPEAEKRGAEKERERIREIITAEAEHPGHETCGCDSCLTVRNILSRIPKPTEEK